MLTRAFSPSRDGDAPCHQHRLLPLLGSVARRREEHWIKLQERVFHGNQIKLLIKVEFSGNGSPGTDSMTGLPADGATHRDCCPIMRQPTQPVTSTSIGLPLWEVSLCRHLKGPIQSRMPLLTPTQEIRAPQRKHS